MTLYDGAFVTQFDGGTYAKSNCTPASGAMAADQATGGLVVRTGSEIRALVRRDEETNPVTPGWSLRDLALALGRISVGLTVPAGGGTWASLEARRAEGRGIVLQGDSDQFGDETCSGAFDGDHCIYLPAVDEPVVSVWRIGDPICRGWRDEQPSVLYAYADKFAQAIRLPRGNVSYAYTDRVPEDDMGLKITEVKGEDWTPRDGRRPVRDRPDRGHGTIIGYIEATDVVRTVAEAKTDDGNVWRQTKFAGRPGWLLRTDFVPVVQGGDPVVDAELDDYIARRSKPTQTVTVSGQGIRVTGP